MDKTSKAKDEALKKEIRAFLDRKPNSDQIDIAEALNIDLIKASQLCDELVAGGKIRRIPY